MRSQVICNHYPMFETPEFKALLQEDDGIKSLYLTLMQYELELMIADRKSRLQSIRMQDVPRDEEEKKKLPELF